MSKKIICFILGLILLIILNLTVNSTDLFSLLLVFSLYLIFINTFFNIKYNSKSSNLLFPSIIVIVFISLIYALISYIIGNLFFEEIKYIFLSMGMTIFIYPTINIIKQYLNLNNKKKNSLLISIIYSFFNLISIIILLLLYNFTSINVNTLISSLFLEQYIPLIIIVILNYKIFKIKKVKLEQLKPIFLANIKKTFISLSILAFYYMSLIFLYFSLTNKYLYDYQVVATLLVDVYFYYYYFIILITIFFYPKKIDEDINTTYIKLFNKLLPLTILISILSGPLLLVFFGSNTNAYIFSLLIYLSLFLIMYNIAMNLLINKKNFNIVLITALLLKIITTIPLINSLYRMGYSMIYGDIISTILSLFIPIVITIIYFNNVHKLNFSNYFSSVINIIYENLILCIILILLQLLVPLKTNNIIEAIGIITIYVIVYIIFNYIKIKFRRIK